MRDGSSSYQPQPQREKLWDTPSIVIQRLHNRAATIVPPASSRKLCARGHLHYFLAQPAENPHLEEKKK